MTQPRRVANRFAVSFGSLLLLCLHLAGASGQAWAGRPPPFTPMTVPALTTGEAPKKGTDTYPGAPVVTSVDPDYGPRHGWTLVELEGKNFQKGLQILIGGREAFDIEFISNSRLRARTPENTFVGSADVVVRNPDGKAGGILNGFLYEGAIFEAPGYNVPPDWNWATCVRLVDMNRDGKRDFLIASPWKALDDVGMGNLVVYLQGPDRDGDGVPNFEPVTRSKALNDTKNHYTSLEAADLDQDGDMDFVATGRVEWYQFVRRDQINRVFLNDGRCNFTVKDLPGQGASKGVDIGDVDRDGNLDIVIANLGGQSQLFLGDGKGSFRNATPTHMPNASLWTTHVHLVDVDGDGDLDAVLANFGKEQKLKFKRKRKNNAGGDPNLLYLNDGKGKFTNQTEAMRFPSGNQRTYRIASGDIDRDGDMDLVFANQGVNQLLVNDGKGHFQATPLPPFRVGGQGPGTGRDVSQARNFDVHFSDINGDGYPDLAFCSNAASLMMYVNVPGKGGPRTFEARPDLIEPRPAGHGSESICLADVDGDGKPDVTIASGHEQTPLWINAWPKGFRFATCNVKLNLPYTDWVTRSCSAGDLNGDGKPDIAMGPFKDKEVLLFLQEREGWIMKTFSDPALLTPGKSVAEALALIDAEGDRDLDIVLGLRNQPTALLLNDGKANFTTAKGQRALPQTPMGTSTILPSDVDLDGDPDLVLCNWERGLLAAGSQKNSLFINEGKGVFRDRSNEYLPQIKSTARGGDVGDINGDGYPDIALACITSTLLAGSMPNQLYLNKGKQGPGQFVDASDRLPPHDQKSTSANLTDVDGDGLLDLLITNEPDMQGLGGEDRLYHLRKDGKYEDWSSRLPTVNRLTWEARILDFNLDRAPDIFFVRSYWNFEAGFGPKAEYGRLLLLANDGKGNFSFPTIRQLQYIDKEYDSWTGSCVYDLNGDGYDEIIECVDGQVRFFQTFLRTKAVAHPVYAEVAAGEAIEFDASSTSYPWGLKGKAFAWQFGDGQNGSGQRVSHTYKKPGKYTVTLKVTDNADREDTDRVAVLVK